MPNQTMEPTDYEKICDFQNLYKAHLQSRKGKREKPEVIRFELNLAENLACMSRDLKNRSYKMSGYYHFMIYEPKERAVFAAYYHDRVLLHCICDEVLAPLLGPRLIYDNAACQIGKGTHFALDRFSKFLREYYKAHQKAGYILKCDISKYFAGIDHEVLKTRLAKIIKDPDLRKLVFHYIDSYETAGRPGRGLPLGNQSSQWFAIYYLDPLDRLVKERLQVKHYVRYMDDCLLIHHDKEFLRACLAQIEALLQDVLHLELNLKTQIYPLHKGVEFLGWRFTLTDTGKVIRKLKPQSKVRIKRRFRKLQKDYAAGCIALEDVKASLASYHGHLTHGNTYQLRTKLYRGFLPKRECTQLDEQPSNTSDNTEEALCKLKISEF